MRHEAIVFVSLFLAATTAVPLAARSENITADIELRLGIGVIPTTPSMFFLGTEESRPLSLGSIQVDLLEHFTIGRATFFAGPYGRFSLIEKTTQYAGGVTVGYRATRKIDILMQIGVAWSARRIGEGTLTIDRRGQSQWTYDLGLGLRYALGDTTYLAVGVGHLSNGEQVGMKMLPSNGGNVGVDYAFVGVGKRFNLFGK